MLEHQRESRCALVAVSKKETTRQIGRVPDLYETRDLDQRKPRSKKLQKNANFYWLFTPLELCYPVRLEFSQRDDYKRKTSTLELESVAILACFSDYVSEYHLLPDLQ